MEGFQIYRHRYQDYFATKSRQSDSDYSSLAIWTLTSQISK